ncbi:MAG: 1,4-dihydroxy-2-naphthoate polyprenyltransferase, partial [uncultured Thermomicrobiales bacterium]
ARPSTAQAWLLATRPKTLPAAIVPPLVGSALALADGLFAPGTAVAALLVALLLQIGANLANDVFDFRRGADTPNRLGPTRVTQSGLIAPERVLAATIGVVAAAVIPGLYLVLRGGWPILILGLLAIAATFAYTGGPFPLGYNGLGEVFVLLFFGIVAVAGTYYVQAGRLTSFALAASLPVGCLVTAILVVNNLRDLEGDRAAGKRTLAVRLGRRATQAEYAGLVAVAYLLLPLFWLAGSLSPWWWLPWLTLPLAVVLVRRVYTVTGSALNAILAGTARLHLLFGVLFAVSILL